MQETRDPLRFGGDRWTGRRWASDIQMEIVCRVMEKVEGRQTEDGSWSRGGARAWNAWEVTGP